MRFYREQRKQKRVKTKLRVNCKKSGVFFSDFTRDISLEGIRVETPALIAKGMIVDLSFNLPAEIDPVIVKGRVVWSNVEEHTDFNVVLGIKFEDISEADKNKLFGFLQNNNFQT